MTEAVHLAAVGLGWWGGMLAGAVDHSGQAELAACFARSPQSREDFAAEHGCRAADSLEAILNDPTIDGLVVATPHATHLEMVERAAAAGKHVFIEKPLTVTVAEGRRCVDVADDAGIVLQVGHHRRKLAGSRRLRALLDEGALGMLHHLEATMTVPKYQEPLDTWRADPEQNPAGAMGALGVHMLDTFQYLAGPITRVTSFSKRVLGRWEIDDATVVAMDFQDGPLGVLTTSLVLPRRNDLAVLGTEGIAWSEEDGVRFFLQEKSEGTRRELEIEPTDPLAEEMAEFAAAIRGETTPETGGPEALAVVAVFEALATSAAEGGAPVDVEPVT